MKRGIMKSALAAALLVTGGAVLQAQAQEDAIDCANAQTQAELNSCAYQDFEKADKELNRVYRKALKKQEEVDREVADMGPNYVGAVKALKKAQRAWIDYRDGHCEGVGFEARGGSMEPMLVSGCMAQLTLERTKQLREFIKSAGD